MTHDEHLFKDVFLVWCFGFRLVLKIKVWFRPDNYNLRVWLGVINEIPVSMYLCQMKHCPGVVSQFNKAKKKSSVNKKKRKEAYNAPYHSMIIIFFYVDSSERWESHWLGPFFVCSYSACVRAHTGLPKNPRREAADLWCLPPVWCLMAVSLIPRFVTRHGKPAPLWKASSGDHRTICAGQPTLWRQQDWGCRGYNWKASSGDHRTTCAGQPTLWRQQDWGCRGYNWKASSGDQWTTCAGQPTLWRQQDGGCRGHDRRTLKKKKIPLFYSSFVLLPSPVALSALSFSAFGPFSWLLFP